MKKLASIVLSVLTVCIMMSVASVPACAIRDKEGKLPLATSAIATFHNAVPQASGSTINEINPSTYIIVAIGILIVVLVSVMLIGYNVKKKKKSAAEDDAEKDEE